MKTLYTRVFAALLLVMAVAFGQIAQATTKTVIYRISSANYNQNYHCYEVGFSRADGSDTPFDGYENLYWMNIDESSLNIGGGSNGAGDYTVSFSDGFSLRLQWEAGSNAIISNQGGININAPSIDKYITYTVTGGSGRYFVTKIEMLNNEGNTGMSDINHHPMNPSFDYAYQLQESFNSRGSFGRIAITYTDAAPITLLTSPSANTYNITSKRDLAVLASYVNVSRNHCINLTFLQTQDIICDDTYVPVGYYNNEDDFACFSGTYDGQGRYIRNITVNRTGNTDADSSVGLFGCISAGTVRNVILASSTFTGYNYVGGIVGFSNGNASGFTTVQNCRVDNSVVIKAGHSNALYHGGIVGYNYTSDAKVIGCFSGAAVSNNGKSGCEYFGGIVGKNDEGTIENCLYIGSIVTGYDKIGAITGYNAGSNLTNNYYNNVNLGGVNSSDVDGARRARTVNLGEDVVIVGDPTVYNVSAIIAIGTGNYAMVSSDSQSDIQLNFKAKELGQYTISVRTRRGTSVPGIKLIDKFEDVIVDLTETPSYTFIGSPSDRQDRFKIMFAETQNFASLQDIFAYQNGAEIIITGEGELQIFDVMGRMIATQYINGSGTWRAASAQTGIYILKLNEKTQKIVVR